VHAQQDSTHNHSTVLTACWHLRSSSAGQRLVKCMISVDVKSSFIRTCNCAGQPEVFERMKQTDELLKQTTLRTDGSEA
jgi:hypothetical protein